MQLWLMSTMCIRTRRECWRSGTQNDRQFYLNSRSIRRRQEFFAANDKIYFNLKSIWYFRYQHIIFFFSSKQQSHLWYFRWCAICVNWFRPINGRYSSVQNTDWLVCWTSAVTIETDKFNLYFLFFMFFFFGSHCICSSSFEK